MLINRLGKRKKMRENHQDFKDIGLGNVVSIGMYDESGKEDLEQRIYVDLDDRYFWIAKSIQDIYDGKTKFVRCNGSQRKEMLVYLAKLRKAAETGKAENYDIEETVRVKRTLHTCSHCGNKFVEEPRKTKDLR